jgi:hypothetical protein
VLANGDEVYPYNGTRLVCKESFERPDDIQELELPCVAHKPSRRLNAQVALLKKLSAQSEFGGLSLRYDEVAFHVACGQALKGSFDAVFVYELKKITGWQSIS